MIPSRRWSPLQGILCAVLCATIAPEVQSAERPNILLIMADDMGFSDIGSYGGEIHTPNLDRLAAEGLRFTQFYNNAKCAPTRASLLTGLYSQQTGVVGENAVMQHSVTLAEVLKTAGYRTLMTGKWHADQLPVERGFDRYYGLTDGCCNFWNPGNPRKGEAPPVHKRFPRKWAIDHEVFRPYTPEDPDFYTTDAFTDYAVGYLDEYKDEDNPFFLYVGYTAPHYPLHAWPEDIAKYENTYTVGWDAIRQRRHRRQIDMGIVDAKWGLAPRDTWTPAWSDVTKQGAWNLDVMTGGRQNKQEWRHVSSPDYWAHQMAVYAAMVDRMDQNIGRILAKLTELGKMDDTLIFFLSDNGGCAERVNLTPDVRTGTVDTYNSVDPPWANAQNTPFRKYKRYNHEGGISTPFIVRWPKVVGANTITYQPGHIIDVMATVLDVSGADYPATYNGIEVLPTEGKSLLPILRGETREPHDYLFWHFNNSKAVRHGDWKLVTSEKGPWELYNLAEDRTELNDVSDANPEIVVDLEAQWNAWSNRTATKPLREPG